MASAAALGAVSAGATAAEGRFGDGWLNRGCCDTCDLDISGDTHFQAAALEFDFRKAGFIEQCCEFTDQLLFACAALVLVVARHSLTCLRLLHQVALEAHQCRNVCRRMSSTEPRSTIGQACA